MNEIGGLTQPFPGDVTSGWNAMTHCVYVVEDNTDLNKDLCEYLEMCGFDVVGWGVARRLEHVLLYSPPPLA